MQQTTSICKELIDQMHQTASVCTDNICVDFYNLRVSPLIEDAANYQSEVDHYMRFLDDCTRQIASLTGMNMGGYGFGQRERER